jgi:TonB family protein
MGDENRKGGNGMAPVAMVEPPPLALEELPLLVGSVFAGDRDGLPRNGSHGRAAGVAGPVLFGNGVAAGGGADKDRVLLIGLVWGKETLIELQQVPVGGELRARSFSNLAGSKFQPEFRVVQPDGDGHVIAVPSGARARVRGADRVEVQVAPQLTLTARYGRAERKAQKSLLATLDVPFASTVAVALLFLALFWLMVRIAPHPDETVTDDLAGNQQRITQYQVKPREKPVEEPPKTRDVSGVQEGAKAREEEGKLGKTEVKKKEAAPSRKGAPLVEPDKRESDRRKVMKLGLVAALAKMGAGSGAASNVLGPGGLGIGINNAMGGVKGAATAGDTYGVGGLGSRGTGQGGGGTALGIGGLGTKGTGAGAGGSGDVDLGGRGKEETQFVPGRTIVIGGLSRDVIDRIIRRHYNEVKYCYEKELTKDRNLYGKVTVVFVIDGTGKVSDALVQQSTMGNEAVEGCIVSHVRRWAFPAPEGGGTVQVTYPYVFKSSAQ